MTCIAAIGDPKSKTTVMGGDRAISDSGGFISISAHPKVMQRGQYLLGFAGSLKFGKLIQNYLEPPEYSKSRDKDLDRFMNTEFVEYLKVFLQEHEFDMFEHKEEIGASVSGLLVGIEGRIFEIEYELAAIEYVDGYAAIGSASEYAIGALAAYKNIYGNKYLKENITNALKVASKHSTTCSEPIDVLSIGDEK